MQQKKKRPVIGYIAPFPNIRPEYRFPLPRPAPRPHDVQLSREELTAKLREFSKEFGKKFKGGPYVSS